MKVPPLLAIPVMLVLLGGAGVGLWFVQGRARGDAGPRTATGSAPGVTAGLDVLEPVVGAEESVGASPDPAPLEQGELQRALNTEAIGLLEAGAIEEAVRLLEECVRAAPEQAVYRSNLAEALVRLAMRRHESERREQRELAVETLARAVELAPERTELAALLERWRRTAAVEDGFATILTTHFEIVFDYSREELGELYDSGALESLLEDTYMELGERFTWFPVEQGARRLRVSIYEPEGFDKVTGLGDWAGGVFDGTVRVPVGSLSPGERAGLQRTLRHELLHAFLAELGSGRVPGWLNEGLAQWVEEPGGSSPRLARAQLAAHGSFPLSRLVGSLATWKDAAAVRLAYAQSLALVAEFAARFGDELPYQLGAAAARGEEVGAAFERLTLGARLEDSVSDLLRGIGGQAETLR